MIITCSIVINKIPLIPQHSNGKYEKYQTKNKLNSYNK